MKQLKRHPGSWRQSATCEKAMGALTSPESTSPWKELKLPKTTAWA
eukprot:CAMPEP_0197697204 /NCGR_PEP_ID=MMETSP1338-20131121/117643_1 /TAXON_ID=43686 ORGANISM="Pelagodinium beii, Strain RCC1491" /NCGR_SAMPLE_ID=MMETSP1338 /ASSEMBLY_ACC=CAM_ASM_000754 /LENGTH=45 /DNA_ID= /DNA_START= /DNA_END= /DNA_ORIENTATION=